MGSQKMNKHTKLAVLIAPFLMVFGFIASDYYLNATQVKKVIFVDLVGKCQLAQKPCIFNAGELTLSLVQQGEKMIVNSTYALQSLIFFVVTDDEKVAKPIVFSAKENYFYWQGMLNLQKNSDKPYQIRFIATIDGHQYISEFLANFA